MENHSDRTCNNCGTKGHIVKYCTKTSFWCQWCHTATHDTQACRSKPRFSTPMESPSTGSYHPTQSPTQQYKLVGILMPLAESSEESLQIKGNLEGRIMRDYAKNRRARKVEGSTRL